jgi:hypothetical protein
MCIGNEKEKQMSVKIKGTLGVKHFASFDKSWEFMRKIEAWPCWTCRAPITREEAVDYHLAYESGGIPAVYRLEAEIYARELAEKRRMEAISLEIKMEKEHRYAMARLAPRDSHEWRMHFDMWHPMYKWGG